jgi:hypothetical protein
MPAKRLNCLFDWWFDVSSKWRAKANQQLACSWSAAFNGDLWQPLIMLLSQCSAGTISMRQGRSLELHKLPTMAWIMSAIACSSYPFICSTFCSCRAGYKSCHACLNYLAGCQEASLMINLATFPQLAAVWLPPSCVETCTTSVAVDCLLAPKMVAGWWSK